MEAGNIKAIIHEILHGTIWTAIDEILHHWAIDWLIGNAGWRYRYCQWSHRND